MSFFNANYSEVRTFELVPVGEYEAVITEVKTDPSKSSGNPMLSLTLTIRTDVDQPSQKRKIFDNIVIQENTMFRVQALMKAVGLAEGAGFNNIEEMAAFLKFKPIRMKVKHENNTYQGTTKLQDRVGYYLPATVPYGGGDLSNGPAGDPFNAPGGAGTTSTPPPLPSAPATGIAPPPWETGGAAAPKTRRGKNKPAEETTITIEEKVLPF